MSLPGKNVTVRRHLPHLPALSKTTKIIVLGTLTAIFVVLEIVIGYASNSLALVADAFHAASDFLSLAIAFYAVRLAQRKMPELYAQLTFGLQRAEVLGALVNATFLLSLCFSIFVQAIERFFSIAREGSGELTQPKLVLIVGAVGLCINIVGMLMFAQDGHHGHDHGTHSHESSGHQHGHGSHRDLNAYGVFLHVFGDALGSVAVIISATIVWLCQGDWRFYMDPAVSVLFTVIVAVTTVPLVMRTARIMLLASPSSISITDLKRRILELDGVIDLHEVHVFELKSGLLVASLHVVLEDCANDGCGQCSPFETPRNYDSIAASIRLVMHQFGVHATTIQPEFV
ncbi:cation efflux protein, partial [Hyaloraphidium curvatum]